MGDWYSELSNQFVTADGVNGSTLSEVQYLRFIDTKITGLGKQSCPRFIAARYKIDTLDTY